MAVVRQQRKNVARNIGVVRADTGASASWRGLSSLADSMIEGSFNELKRQAREKGIETAQAASQADLRSLDPETGEPKAFQIPQGFGTEAQDAYNNIIERRYIALTESDFKQKAAELAQQYRYTPDGASLFDEEFGKFVESTSKGAAPKFSNIINEVGSSLQASYKLTLTSENAEQERRNNADSVIVSITEHAKTIRALNAGPNFVKGKTPSSEDAREAYDAGIKQIKESALSMPDLFPPSRVNTLTKELDSAIFDGTAQRIVAKVGQNNGSLTVVNDVQQVIQTGGVGLEDLPDYIKADVKELLDNDKLNDFSDAVGDILSKYQSRLSVDQTQKSLTESEEQSALNKQRAEEQEAVRLGLSDLSNKANEEIGNALSSGNFPQAVSLLNQFETNLKGKAAVLGNTSATDQEFRKARHLLQERLGLKLNNMTDLNKMTDVSEYIVNEGVGVDITLPDDLKVIADTMINTANYDEDFQNITSALSKFVNAKQKVANATKVSQDKQETIKQIRSGTANPASQANKEAIEEAITKSKASPEYFFGEGFEKRFEWGKISVQTGILPSSVFNAVRNLANGTGVLSESAMQQAVEYYGQFSSVAQEGSTKSQNMFLNAGMSAEEIGVLDAALFATSMDPEGYKNFPVILARHRSIVQEPDKYNVMETSILGDESLNNFVARVTSVDKKGILTGETPNPNVAYEMKPYIQYQIVSRKSKDVIESDIKRYFEQHYHKLSGVVIDPAFQQANRSRQGLTGAFPESKMPVVVSVLNKMLSTNFGINDAKFRLDSGRGETDDFLSIGKSAEISKSIEAVESAGGEASLVTGTDDDLFRTKRVRLMPVRSSGTSQSENIVYMVVELDGSGTPRPFITTIKGDGPESDTTELVYITLDDIRKNVANEF